MWENLYRLEPYIIIVANKYFSGLGEKVRDFGGRVCDVCSVDNLKKGGLVALALGVGAGSSACLSSYGKAVVRNLGETAAQQVVVSSVQKEFGPKYETNVVINNSGGTKYVRPELVFVKWTDGNGDRYPQDHEFGESVGDYANVNDCTGIVAYVAGIGNAPISYTLFLEGKLIGEDFSDMGTVIVRKPGNRVENLVIKARGNGINLSRKISLSRF